MRKLLCIFSLVNLQQFVYGVLDNINNNRIIDSWNKKKKKKEKKKKRRKLPHIILLAIVWQIILIENYNHKNTVKRTIFEVYEKLLLFAKVYTALPNTAFSFSFFFFFSPWLDKEACWCSVSLLYLYFISYQELCARCFHYFQKSGSPSNILITKKADWGLHYTIRGKLSLVILLR